MLSKQAILLLLIWSLVITSNCEQYFIVPARNPSTPECFSCLTIDDFAYFSPNISGGDINVTILSGNHTLTEAIQIQNLQSMLITTADQNTSLEIADGGSVQLSMIDQLTIEGMKFIGSNINPPNKSHGFIINNISSVSIVNCHFMNFNLPNQNGIIVNTLTTSLLMLGSTFAHNNATALYTKAQNVHIENCNFSKNTHGAVQIQHALNNNHIVLINTNFDSNSASRGGAVKLLSGYTNITNCTFTNNHAQFKGGAIYYAYGNTLISNCEIRNNNCDQSGGGIYIESGDATIHNSELTYNSATQLHGGALYVMTGNVFITDSELSHNQAGRRGGAVYTSRNIYFNDAINSFMLLSVANSKLSNNAVKPYSVSNTVLNISDGGAAIYANSSKVTILQCEITENRELSYSGAVQVREGSIIVSNSVLTKNTGGIYVKHCTDYCSVVDSEFSNNNEVAFKVWNVSGNNAVNITNCLFINNTGTIEVSYTPLVISHCIFDNNKGAISARFERHVTIENSVIRNNIGGGLVLLGLGTISAHISNTKFISNRLLNVNMGQANGASISVTSGNLEISNSTFNNNVAINGAIIDIVRGILTFRNMTTIENNVGNINVFNARLDFTGPTLLNNNSGELGGTIRAEESEVYLNSPDGIIITNNKATIGGGLFLTRSSLFIQNPLTISHNSAQDGGGIYAHSTKMEFKTVPFFEYKTSEPNILISENRAQNGGGIFASASLIDITDSYLSLDSNNATHNGGGMYLQQNMEIQLFKTAANNKLNFNILVIIFNNTAAQFGGGIFVADHTVGGTACRSGTTMIQESQCFLQTISFHTPFFVLLNPHYYNTFLKENSAVRGSDIYGGLLDRCTIRSNADHPDSTSITTLDFILDTIATDIFVFRDNISMSEEMFKTTNLSQEISTIQFKKNLSIASDPMQVKLCDPKEIQARKGDRFTIAVTALDQVGNPVSATIRSSIVTQSGVSRLKEGQIEQTIHGECDLLEYNVFSQDSSARVELFADGPCLNLGPSNQSFGITFLPCTCPMGLQPTQSLNECMCECDTALQKHQITTCSYDNGTIQVETQIWVGVENSTENGFVVSDCPFDYCVDVKPIQISLSSLNEIDQQCAFNRSGTLCGQCQEGLSLVLASSKCQECSNIYLLLILPFSLAGILLVLLILVFNLTVATGSIHGLIFYANILAANRSVFLPFQNFLTVFISWVNLDLGIETCFYDGMSSQAKVLLQLAFPVYLFLLIFLIIILSKYFDSFAKLLSNRNPVAALSTLMLLSYSKLLRFIIASFQYTTLKYPDGTSDTVWLIDANVLYLTPQHTPRFIASALIRTFGGLFTLLLFFGQWIPRLSKWKLMVWTRNTKYNGFMDTFHAPFNPKHRYWVGLLLFVLIAQNLISALALNAFLPVFSAGSLAVGLAIYKSLIFPVYSVWLHHLVETLFFLNLSLFSYGSLYVGLSHGNQYILANVSLAVAFALFVFVLCYHCYKYVLKRSPVLRNKHNMFQLKERNPQAQSQRNKNTIENREADTASTVLYSDDVTEIDTDSDRYITPPIVRSAVRPDQLRVPALDDLAPITTGDYEQIPPSIQPTPDSHSHITYAVIEITK